MCKTLFRFEDKYGMHSIVTSFKGITKDASTDFYNVGDIYVQSDYRVYRAYVQQIS